MDHFGIGAGVKGAAEVYFRAGRRTGKTSLMVDSLKTGDRVVFLDEREGRRVQSLCRDRGVSIEIIVCDTSSPDRLLGRPTPFGSQRTIFDHSWVEKFYLGAIERARRDIDRLERELSGGGAPCTETRAQVLEAEKWMTY